MDQSARDVQSFWAAQTTQRDPEELSDRLNAPSAQHGTAAADTRSGCQPPTSAKPEDPSDVRAAPRPAIEDKKGKEQGAAEAAVTLERLRAQNRRHQANHRARVKVLITSLGIIFTPCPASPCHVCAAAAPSKRTEHRIRAM